MRKLCIEKFIALGICFILTSFLVSAAPPTPRTFWSQNGNSKYNSQSVPVGTVITAYDPQGILCGQFTTTTTGQFSFDCVGDDPDTTGTDEGGSSGDTIVFYMNGNLASVTGGSAEWQSGFQEVNIEAVEGCDDNADCDDGVYCNGAETCNLGTNKCQDGTSPATDDGVGCTDDSCDEANDKIVHTPNDNNCPDREGIAKCDNNPDNNPFTWDSAPKVEGVCHVTNDCQLADYSFNPVDCTLSEANCEAACNADNDCACQASACIDSDNDGNLDDYAAYPQYGDCKGDCTCDTGTSQGQACSVTITVDDGVNCGTCTENADCDNDLFCDGIETCSSGFCKSGTPPVTNDGVSCTDDSCNEASDQVLHTPNNGKCDDGAYCNGAETCHATNDCQAGTPPVVDDGVGCTDDTCDETNDKIVNTPNNGKCDDGAYCNGAETCDAVNDCQDGTTIDCSSNSFAEIASCGNNPDNNQFTWDYAAGFTSACNEATDSCTTSSQTLSHQCRDDDTTDGVKGNSCGAACDENSDCDDGDSSTIDTCKNDCTCENSREICDNGQDDDGDGNIDCADTDCAGQQGPTGAVCCQNNDGCNALDAACADGVCNTNECEQQFKPATTVCSPKNGECDIAETCTGNSPACPANAVEPITTECRAAVGDCDVAETCDGANKVCPADTFKLAGNDCGVCAECDGAGACGYDETQDNDCAACPADICTDENNDGVIDAYNDYNVAQCQAVYTCGDCGPTTTEPDARCKTARKVSIEQGVTMFSLPLMPDTPKTFNDLEDGCAFTAEYVNNGIAYYNPIAKDYTFIDGNTQLHPGQGYFTTQQNNCDLTIEGMGITTKKIGYLGTDDIYAGWNMIGATSEDIANVNTVKGTCNLASSSSLFGFNPVTYSYFGTWNLQSGKGYFAKMTGDCHLG